MAYFFTATCDELGCLGNIAFFANAIPIMLLIINIVGHTILGEKLISRLNKPDQEEYYRKVINRHCAILVFLFSVLPYIIYFMVFSSIMIYSKIMEPRINRYNKFVKLNNFSQEIIWIKRDKPYGRLVINADALVAESGKYHFVNTGLYCFTVEENHALIINGRDRDSQDWRGEVKYKDPYGVDLSKGQSRIRFEFIFDKIKPVYEDKNLFSCWFEYSIVKRDKLKNAEFLSLLRLKPADENFIYKVDTHEYWSIPEFSINELTNRPLPE